MRRTVSFSIAAHVVASVCFAVVAIERWWPCVGVGLQTAACGQRQDDSYEAAQLAAWPVVWQWWVLAAAYLLAGAGVLAAVWSRGRTSRGAGVIAAALPWLSGLLMVRMPGVDLLDGLGGLTMVIVVALSLGAGPLAASGLALGHRGWPWTWLVGLGVTLMSVVVDFWLVAPLISLGYTSWDTNPGTFVSPALGCALAAIGLTGLRDRLVPSGRGDAPGPRVGGTRVDGPEVWADPARTAGRPAESSRG